MTASLSQSRALMNTIVTVAVVGHDSTDEARRERDRLTARALDWFAHVERACSRFDPESELRQLSARIGEAVPVTPLLLQVVQFALAVAEESDGAFDPTIGGFMHRLGFAHDYRRGLPGSDRGATEHEDVVGSEGGEDADDGVSWRDVHVDEGSRTITLDRPLLLDLGAVAKGLAIDLAARELAPLENFAIDAGGDLYLAGCNAEGGPWRVGIRDPRAVHAMCTTLQISDRAVCTSGDYERRVPHAVQQRQHEHLQHHLRDARTGAVADQLASVTVVAPSAMVADALATAAFALGPSHGRELLERHQVDALLITPTLARLSVGTLVHV